MCPNVSKEKSQVKVSPLPTGVRVFWGVCEVQQAEEWEGKLYKVFGLEHSLFPRTTSKRSVINLYLGSNKTTLFILILNDLTKSTPHRQI